MKPIKYKGVIITPTPTQTYPNLVTLTKGIKKANGIVGKKFLTHQHAEKYIDDYLGVIISTLLTEERIERQEEGRARREKMKLNGIYFATHRGKHL